MNRIKALFFALMVLLFPAGILHAQLDPRLQGTNSDFLDLYQQSATAKVKPEIVTVFDFSGSMATLMYHPMFVNSDADDSSSKGNMSFKLTAGTAAVDGNNTYTITATSNQNSSASVTWTVTINGTASYGGDSSERVQTVGKNTNKRYLYTKVAGTVTPSGTISGAQTYVFSAAVTMRATNSTGSSITLGTYSSSLDGGITWTVSGGTRTPSSSSAIPTSSATTWTSSDQTCAWTVPSYDSGIPGTDPYVTASLDSYSLGTLTTTQLIKPNGSVVKASDADGAKSYSGDTLYGTSQGMNDVRNWVRAASHARFTYTDSGTLRTIDIPIPWKVLNESSSGSPLSSWTAPDPTFTKKDATGTSKSYGTGNNIEMDLTYKLQGGSLVLTGDAGTPRTSTTLNTTRTGYVGTYRKDYVDWLFKGKYTDGTYKGKYIVFDAANASIVGGQENANWGQGFGAMSDLDRIKVPIYAIDGTYLAESWSSAAPNPNPKGLTQDPTAKSMRIPALTRVQASKVAAIQTWIKYQADVYWAYRFLDVSNESGKSSMNNNSATTLDSTDPTGTVMDGGDSGWMLLNSDSAGGMKRLAALFAYNGTPLTYATARALAQFNDPNSVFKSVETAPADCGNHFLIVFTDGVDNNNTSTPNPNSNTPYLKYNATSGKTEVSAVNGNKVIMANPSTLLAMPSGNYGGSYWNIFTFAGMAAHMADSSLGTGNYMAASDPGTTTTSGTPDKFLPYAIYKRGSTVFSRPHRITTMTVGVSLGGLYTESGAKRNLFLAAAAGDASLTSWSDLDTLKPFQWDESTGKKVAGTLYYFDATNPNALITSLGYAIQSAVGESNINASANPNTPYIGASLGQEIYVGKFQPPQNGGAIWGGDLMMFGTRVQNNQVVIIDKAGEPTTTLDTTTSQWNTKAVMDAKTWSTRTLYTRVPEGTGLTTFSDQDTGYAAIKAYVAQSGSSAASYPVDSDAQKRVIQFAMGGDTPNTAAGTRPSSNRANIMGDIINSSPTAIEYKWDEITKVEQSAITTSGGNRFRLILVGTNQGWLHAFGEVTWDQEIKDSSGNTKYTIKQGRVAELWAFMPTDFLGYLDQITIESNPHRFMVDGSPVIYHLDLPASSGGSGDGVVGSGERAVAIFGLGKGGRSYYALDVSNPFSPTLRWSLVPDEAAKLTSDRIQDSTTKPSLDTVKSVVGKMGYSTCTPGIGRITHKNASDKAILRDAVFLGGGFSRPEIEVAAKFGAPLGRSVLALDAYSGNVLSVQDFSDLDANSNPKYGPVVKGVVPFEFLINSGMAQRAYFLDYWGGLWAWGSTATDTNSASTTYQYRVDTSELTAWGLRRIAQDKNGSVIKDANGKDTQQYSEALYTTLPAPFRVGTFSGKPRSSGKAIPAVVGIAMESGDRNNPLDLNYASGTMPAHHRLAVIFDRQDSEAWGTDASPVVIKDQASAASATDSGDGRVMNAYPGGSSLQAGNAVISPGSDAYYLAPMTGEGESRTMDTDKTKFGYYRKFPDIKSGTTYLPKGINTPAVVSGSLFYSFFTPTSVDVCTGGSGETASNLICDVLNPIVDDNRTNLSCDSGTKYTWYGTASDYIPFGTRGVIQIGTVSATNPDTGKITTSLASQTITGQAKAQYPKPRVWRTVH